MIVANLVRHLREELRLRLICRQSRIRRVFKLTIYGSLPTKQAIFAAVIFERVDAVAVDEKRAAVFGVACAEHLRQAVDVKINGKNPDELTFRTENKFRHCDAVKLGLHIEIRRLPIVWQCKMD